MGGEPARRDIQVIFVCVATNVDEVDKEGGELLRQARARAEQRLR